MKEYVSIESVLGREILDSRGNPTVEVEVYTDGGYFGRAAVPSGASVGVHEAHELRDGAKSRYRGRGVLEAVTNINEVIAPEIEGMNVFDQAKIDKRMLELDGTDNKSRLGANAMLGVSLAVAKAASEAAGLSYYMYLGGVNARMMPIPMVNIMNGGRHADNSLNIQEFLIVPIGASSFSEALEWSGAVQSELRYLLKSKNLSTAIGDEGGFVPNLATDEDALALLMEAINEAGFTPGKDISLGIGAAASEMHAASKQMNRPEDYYFWKTEVAFYTDDLIDYWESLVNKYPIVAIEDGIAEDDWKAWEKLTSRLGDRVMIIGDDLFVTQTERLKYGVENHVANSIAIKLNEVGTLTEVMNAIAFAHRAGYKCVISARSGETEDTTIADLAVAVNSGYIKTGAPQRSERVAKFNQLLRIEEELGEISVYPTVIS